MIGKPVTSEELQDALRLDAAKADAFDHCSTLRALARRLATDLLALREAGASVVDELDRIRADAQRELHGEYCGYCHGCGSNRSCPANEETPSEGARPVSKANREMLCSDAPHDYVLVSRKEHERLTELAAFNKDAAEDVLKRFVGTAQPTPMPVPGERAEGEAAAERRIVEWLRSNAAGALSFSPALPTWVVLADAIEAGEHRKQ